MFINFSNHPSERWCAQQVDAAERYGQIRDIAFPEIAPEMNEAALDRLAQEYAVSIAVQHPAAVLCQGEATFSFRVIRQLNARGIVVLAACTRRQTLETVRPDGSVLKQSVFAFAGFRRYDTPGGA